MSDAYAELCRRLRDAHVLSSSAALLEWDQETFMPARAGEFRAEQISMLARMVHDRVTSPEIADLIARCEGDAALLADPAARANVREMRRDHDRATRLPSSLVAEMSETSSRALEVWKLARRDSDFAAFAPWLERQVELHRHEAACHGAPPGGEPYDALLEDYEPGMRSARLGLLFTPLRDALRQLIARAGSGGRPEPSDAPQRIRLPVEAQRAFHHRVAAAVGYDFEAGRLDVSTHPFTTGLAPGDTRITTRFAEDQFVEALGSTLHEVGHALYEQGLPKAEHHGQPLAEAVSLGMHESQSRLWENQVGRSLAFWRWAVPEARGAFGAAFGAFTPEDLFLAVNAVRPGLIRVEADEVTYNLHVMMRFDLERAMLRDDLRVPDLPAAWNERMRADLDLEVPDDRRGCLQDVHWPAGMIGYFPTYTLGNLYAAQLWEAVGRELPDVEERIARGDFASLAAWLRDRIHVHGRRFPAEELCREITGRPLEVGPLARWLDAKVRAVYGE